MGCAITDYFLGVDVGSVSTNLVLTDTENRVRHKVYLRNNGRPTDSVLRGLRELPAEPESRILGVGTTGSGRKLAGYLLGADVVKNEIIAHGVAALVVCPTVGTVMEIGGQDSKIIFFENGVITDFNMNTVCAAGTGSFLDRTAGRLGVPVEKIGPLAASASEPVRIAGRCAVFAESDMIHKQQEGFSTENILGGLCRALVGGYLNNLCRGKKIREPVLFQGGVAANEGIRKCFEEELGLTVTVPKDYDVMGALGAAILAHEHYSKGNATAFRGFGAFRENWETENHVCCGCRNNCTITLMKCGKETVGEWGARCGNPKLSVR